MSELEQYWADQLQGGINARRKEARSVRRRERAAEIVCYVFVIMGIVMMGCVDGPKWGEALTLMCIFFMCAFVAHLVSLCWRDIADDIEGLLPWQRR